MGRAFYWLVAALVIGGVAGAPIRALLPAYVEGQVKAAPSFTSLLLAIQLGVGGIFALAGGSLSDRLSRRTIVLLGVPSAIPGALLFATHDPVYLVPMAVVWGVLTGFQASGGQSFLMSAVEPSKTGTATAVFFLTTTMSGAIGAWAGGVAADAFGYDVVAAGGAVLALIGVATAARFLPDLGSDTSRSGSASHASGGMDYLTVFRQPGMWTIVLLRFWPTVAWGIATLVIPLYLYRIAGNATVPGTYALVSLVIASGGQLLTGRLIDRGARMSVGSVAGVPVALRRLTAVVSVGLLIAGAAAIFATDNVYVLGAAGTVWTVMAWALSTTMPALMRGAVPTVAYGRAVGLTHLVWSGAMLTGTTVGGLLVEVNHVAPLIAATACLAVSAVVAVRFAIAAEHSADHPSQAVAPAAI